MNKKRSYERVEISISIYEKKDVLIASDDNYGYIPESWGTIGNGGGKI